ncbi:DUF2334 domain-containing protein [Bacillus sp. BRMEA1]|uniref:DUF2334 domain-containing protein n=1 Tax=Neobacillus endophyticus TaxID=2738405 RepID=UPI001566D178|nr:DUF2334 domain-containing protein [Neobacillus endophyticus]NRD77022.1 DUF2334 domain-containing protein [Neobacillus endophyticus]
MNRKFWKWFSVIIGTVMIVLAVLVYFVTYTGANIYPDANKKHVMIRLEDVGPGGEYNSLADLGKLRAVMEYLESQHIPFQVAVIPRRMSIGSDHIWQERGIDDPKPDAVVTAFIRLLQEAEQHHGVLGMHGYTHQYGDVAKADNSQNSGIGTEFNVKNAPETKEASYAEERITDSLSAFYKAGLHPAFWESPHYKDTREQEKVFRSYMGILYQPDLYSLRSLKDLNVYDTVNSYGQNSLGSVYVPAPYSYVTNGKSVDNILSKAAHSNGLASFYYHPFLEFPNLEPVTGKDGKPIVKDGLPEYRYKQTGQSSYLHRLVMGFKKEGYHWRSLFDIVPFTPAHRVTLPPDTKTNHIMLGDVTGSGYTDVVVREAHRIMVIPGNYLWPRNRPQEASEVWLKYTSLPEEQSFLTDINHDGKQDLIFYNKQNGDLKACLAGKGLFESPILLGKLPSGLASLQSFQNGEDHQLIATKKRQIILIRIVNNQLISNSLKTTLTAGSTFLVSGFQDSKHDGILSVSPKNHKVFILYNQGDNFTKPFLIKGIDIHSDDQILAGDTNGDGRSDIIVYSRKDGVWRVYENKGNGHFSPISNDFGPWAEGLNRSGFIADFDGNGKMDIGSYDEANHVLDVALSFRGPMPKSKGKK